MSPRYHPMVSMRKLREPGPYDITRTAMSEAEATQSEYVIRVGLIMIAMVGVVIPSI